MGSEKEVAGAECGVPSSGTDGNVVAQEQGRGTALGTQGDAAGTAAPQGDAGGTPALRDWREISGFVKGEEWKLSPEARTEGLGKLFTVVEQMIVEEIGAQEAPVSRLAHLEFSDWVKPFTLNRATGRTDKIQSEQKYIYETQRTYLWDPVRAVALRLNIPMSKLSNLSKMYSGMSAFDLVDRIRAKKLKPMFWKIMAKFAIKLWGRAGAQDFNRTPNEQIDEWQKWVKEERSLERGHPGAEFEAKLDPTWSPKYDNAYKDNLPGADVLLGKFWTAWKKFRRSMEFDKEVWAHECGYASYARMRKGCQLEYGMPPQMLEYQIAQEIAEYYNVVQNRNERERMIADPTIPQKMKPAAPYLDGWSCVEHYKPEWLEKMKKVFGLVLNYEPQS